MNRREALEEYAALKSILREKGWSPITLDWFKDRFVKCREKGGQVVMKEGYMGGTQVYCIPEGDKLRPKYRIDIEERYPGGKIKELVFNNQGGEECQEKPRKQKARRGRKRSTSRSQPTPELS